MAKDAWIRIAFWTLKLLKIARSSRKFSFHNSSVWELERLNSIFWYNIIFWFQETPGKQFGTERKTNFTKINKLNIDFDVTIRNLSSIRGLETCGKQTLYTNQSYDQILENREKRNLGS